MSQLYEKPLPVGEVGNYTLTVNPKWLGDESILSVTAICDGATTLATNIENNVIEGIFRGDSEGYFEIKWEWETATRSDCYKALIRILDCDNKDTTLAQVNKNPTVQDVLDTLAYGNFRSVASSQEGLGFKSSELPMMLAFINPAIQEVFNRFNLGMNKIKIVFEKGRNKYALNKNYAYSSVGTTGTIDDTIENPLTGTVSTIVFVETEDEYIFSINDRSEEYLVSTSNPSFIRVNDELLAKEKGIYLYIVTQPSKLVLDTSDTVRDTELSIPEHFLEVVSLCVAKLYYSSSGSRENVQKAALFNNLYEQAVQVLMDSGAKQDMEYFSPAGDMREWA